MKKVAVVMAGTSGLGRACAEALAAASHEVVVCARRADALERTVSALRAKGSDALGIPADVSKRDDLERVFVATEQRFGRLDVLVTNAGGPPPGTLLPVTDEQWSAAYELPLMSAVRAMRAAVAPHRTPPFS